MWKEIFSVIREIFVLSEKTDQNKTALAELRLGLRDTDIKVSKLTEIVQILIQENARLREEMNGIRREEAKEREKIVLKLENEMLKFEKRLPPSSTKKKK